MPSVVRYDIKDSPLGVSMRHLTEGPSAEHSLILSGTDAGEGEERGDNGGDEEGLI